MSITTVPCLPLLSLNAVCVAWIAYQHQKRFRVKKSRVLHVPVFTSSNYHPHIIHELIIRSIIVLTHLYHTHFKSSNYHPRLISTNSSDTSWPHTFWVKQLPSTPHLNELTIVLTHLSHTHFFSPHFKSSNYHRPRIDEPIIVQTHLFYTFFLSTFYVTQLPTTRNKETHHRTWHIFLTPCFLSTLPTTARDMNPHHQRTHRTDTSLSHTFFLSKFYVKRLPSTPA